MGLQFKDGDGAPISRRSARFGGKEEEEIQGLTAMALEWFSVKKKKAALDFCSQFNLGLSVLFFQN